MTPAEPHTLKLLHRLSAADTFEVVVEGFPTLLQELTARAHFLRFAHSMTQVIMFPIPMEIVLSPAGCEETPGRFTGTVPDDVEPGMYLMSGLTITARMLDGRLVVGCVGTTHVPLMPKLGFCFDHDVCSSAQIQDAYEFVALTLP